MSGKLGVDGAYTRRKTSSFLPTLPPNVNSNSAAQCKMENEIKLLKEVNNKLKSDLMEMRAAFKQITCESGHEKFDERRINLIKLQVIQLEKQITILNEALGCRMEAILEVENTMACLSNKLRSYIASEVKGPNIPISRSNLSSMLESLESSRIKLFKSVEHSGKERLGKTLLFLNPFLSGHGRTGATPSLLDISLNRMDYINMRHVSQLESKLSLLYKELIVVHEHLQNLRPERPCQGHICTSEHEMLETRLLKSCVMMKDAADDLLALSLLCPCAPWPALKRPLTKDITVDRIISALPPLPNNKRDEIIHVFESIVKTCNHRNHLLDKERTVLKEELTFHRSVYDLQMQYIHDLFDAVSKGYLEFENSARTIISEPIKEVLDAYSALKTSVSENALRKYLTTVKAHEQELLSIAHMFSKEDTEDAAGGSGAISSFGAEFMTKLDSLVQQCISKRDLAVRAKGDVKKEQELQESKLQLLITQLEEKYSKQWLPRTNHISGLIQNEDNMSSYEEKVTAVDDIDVSGEKPHTHRLPADADDLTILRSYLYESNSVDRSSTHLSDTEDEVQDKIYNSKSQKSGDYLKTEGLRNEKKHSKSGSKWKPKKPWVNDFSEPNSLPESEDFKSGSSDAGFTEKNRPLLGRGSEAESSSTVSKLPSCEKKRNFHGYQRQKPKKLTYEPNLSVPMRTLKLKQYGSCTDINTVDTDNK